MLAYACTFRYHLTMKTKHTRTKQAIFAKPTQANIRFADIEALVVAMGGEVIEREGSRVRITLRGEEWRPHRPHPGKEAKKYQVEEFRELLERTGEKP
jgi:transcriptional antiterminator Rof (Rho-off)